MQGKIVNKKLLLASLFLVLVLFFGCLTAPKEEKAAPVVPEEKITPTPGEEITPPPMPTTGEVIWEQVATNEEIGNSPIKQFITFGDYLYVISWNGVYRTNNGTDWQQVMTKEELDLQTYTAGAIGELNGYLYLIGSGKWKDSGKVSKSANGTDWGIANKDKDFNPGFAEGIANFNNYLYLVSSEGVFRSSNGSDWEQTAIGFDWGQATTKEIVGTLKAVASFGDYLYIGGNGGLFRSSNGVDWQQVATEEMSSGSVEELGKFNNYLYVSGPFSGMYRSTNGIAWEKVNAPKELDWMSLSEFGNFNGYLYAGTINGSNSGIFRTNDGNDWQQVATENELGGGTNAFGTFHDYLYAAIYNQLEEPYGFWIYRTKG